MTSSQVGTPEFMSPEMAEALATHSLRPFDELCDVWSLGVILYAYIASLLSSFFYLSLFLFFLVLALSLSGLSVTLMPPSNSISICLHSQLLSPFFYSSSPVVFSTDWIASPQTHYAHRDSALLGQLWPGLRLEPWHALRLLRGAFDKEERVCVCVCIEFVSRL